MPVEDAPAAVRWVAIQAVILWGVALVVATFGILPNLGLRAGVLALVAGAAIGLALVWRTSAEVPPSTGESPSGTARWANLAWLGVATAIAFGLHAWAASRAGVPIGYDYGYYKVAFEAYEGGAPSDPPHWMTLQFEPALPALHAVLSGVSGISATQHLTWLWAVLACAMVPAVFVAARPLAGPQAAAGAALIMAVSFTQGQAYAYLYEKNVLALVLFTAALFLLGRRSWVAAGLVLAGVAAMNRPTALWALLALPLVALPRLRQEWRGWATTAGVGLAVALPIWLAWPETFFDTGSAVAQDSLATLSSGAAGGEGTFFGGRAYLTAAAAYLPFAVAAMVLAYRRPDLRLPATALAVAGLYVALKLPLHLRFLLMADVVAVLLAGAALATVLPRRWTAAAIGLVVVLAAAPTVAEILDPDTPHVFVTPDQFHAIQDLRALPANATLIGDNLRAPYILAETGHRTFGPGLFDDPHTRDDWGLFWRGLDEEGLEEFLAPFEAEEIYVLQAAGPGPDWGSASLHEPAFRLESTAGGINLWHWTGGQA